MKEEGWEEGGCAQPEPNRLLFIAAHSAVLCE
jgi:hypothetical protein